MIKMKEKFIILMLIITFESDLFSLSVIDFPLTIDLTTPIVTSMQLQGKIYYYNDEDYHNDTMVKLEKTGKDIDSLKLFVKLGQDNLLEEFKSHCAEGVYKEGCSFIVNILHKGLNDADYKIQYKVVNGKRNMYVLEFSTKTGKHNMFMVMSLFNDEYKLLYPEVGEYSFFKALNRHNRLEKNEKDRKEVFNNSINIIKDEINSTLKFNGYVIKTNNICQEYSIVPNNEKINKIIKLFLDVLKNFEELSIDEFAKLHYTEKSRDLFLENIKKMNESTFYNFRKLITKGINIYYIIDANPIYIIFFTTYDKKQNWISHKTKKYNYIYCFCKENNLIITRTCMQMHFDNLLKAINIDNIIDESQKILNDN